MWLVWVLMGDVVGMSIMWLVWGVKVEETLHLLMGDVVGMSINGRCGWYEEWRSKKLFIYKWEMWLVWVLMGDVVGMKSEGPRNSSFINERRGWYEY